jgi:hypothetical protein
MIAGSEALKLMQEFLAKEHPAGGVAVNVAATVERPYGWIFSYNTIRALETGDYTQGLVGNGPLLVRRNDGRIIRFPSLYSAVAAAEAYEENPNRFPPIRG